MRVPGSSHGTPFRRAMSYRTPRVTMPFFIVMMEFFRAPSSIVTSPSTS